MKAELITIGDEILIGQIVNTNSVFLAKALNDIGIEITQITSISDKKDDIIGALKLSEKRAKLVILTGGLGPTSDDLTKQTLCSYFNDKLIENKEILNHIEEIFKNVSDSAKPKLVIVTGKSSNAEAKIAGITPAVLIFNGK